MSIKILATGDIHIGQRVSGFPDSAGNISARETWNRIVDWSVTNPVDALVLTGDIVDQNNSFFEAIGPLQDGFSRLKEKGIPVYLIAGNHDYNVLHQVAINSGHDNINMLGPRGKWGMKLFRKGEESVQFAGWSFPSQYVREDPLLKFDLETDRSIPCIGLLHGEVTSTGSEYGPLSLNRLGSLPVDCWILGHIHKPQKLSVHPYVCYPGSPLAFSSKEQGLHGPLLITIENGIIKEPQRILFSPVRFDSLDIDITGVCTEDEFRNKIISELNRAGEDIKEELEEVRYLIYDVTLTGSHNNVRDLEKWSLNLPGDVEIMNGGLIKKVNRTTFNVLPETGNLKELSELNSPIGLLAGTILAINKGMRTDFLDKLIRNFRSQYSNACNSEVFMPLELRDTSNEQQEAVARRYILKESTRLLSELMQQKK